MAAFGSACLVPQYRIKHPNYCPGLSTVAGAGIPSASLRYSRFIEITLESHLLPSGNGSLQSVQKKNRPIGAAFLFVAGAGFEPAPSGYEPLEVPFLHPAN